MPGIYRVPRYRYCFTHQEWLRRPREADKIYKIKPAMSPGLREILEENISAVISTYKSFSDVFGPEETN